MWAPSCHQLLPGARRLKVLLAHIPDKYEHLVRYYGCYSNRARGERKDDTSAGNTSTLHIDETPADRKSKANRGEPEIEKGPVDLFPGERPHNGCAGWGLAKPVTLRQGWQARCIKWLYEADPLDCLHCGHTMRMIAVIDDTAIIRGILKHLRLWDPLPEPPNNAASGPPWPDGETIPLTYHPVPGIA